MPVPPSRRMAHMQPMRTLIPTRNRRLEYQLVKIRERDNELRKLLRYLRTRDMDIDSLTAHVLRLWRATYPGVQLRATEATRDYDATVTAAERLQHSAAQRTKVLDVPLCGIVLDIVSNGGAGAKHLRKGEVLRQPFLFCTLHAGRNVTILPVFHSIRLFHVFIYINMYILLVIRLYK